MTITKFVICALLFTILYSIDAFGAYEKNGSFYNAYNVSLDTNKDENVTDRTIFSAIFWELKPFIFYNRNTEKWDGIFPEMFLLGDYFCGKAKGNAIKVMNFTHNVGTRQKFSQTLQNIGFHNKSLNESIPVYFPILAPSNITWEQEHNVISFQLTNSKDLALIVRRDVISLPSKIFRGIYNCREIFMITIILAIIFGILIWFFEYKTNEGFNSFFLTGASIGLWWSTVSMTTVGYGDIVPGSPIGRLLAFVWILIGVMISCCMTATMTNIVSGVDDLSVFDQKIAVLDNSFEVKAASYYHAKTVPYSTYEEVIQSVRENDDIFGALINADVAVWRHKELREDPVPLSIIKLLPSNLWVKMLVHRSVSPPLMVVIKELFDCMKSQKEEVYLFAEELFKKNCEAETLYIGDMKTLIQNNSYVMSLIISACLLITFGLIHDLRNCMKIDRGYTFMDYLAWFFGQQKFGERGRAKEHIKSTLKPSALANHYSDSVALPSFYSKQGKLESTMFKGNQIQN